MGEPPSDTGIAMDMPHRSLQSELNDAFQRQSPDEDRDNETPFSSLDESVLSGLNGGSNHNDDNDSSNDLGIESSTIETSKLFRSQLQELPSGGNDYEDRPTDLSEHMEELLRVHRLLHRKLTKDWDGISKRLLDAEEHFGGKTKEIANKMAVLQAMAKEMQSVQHKYADALGSGSCDLDTGKLEGDIKMLSLRTSELEGTVAGILAKDSKFEADRVELRLELAKLAEDVNAGTDEASQGHRDLQQEVDSLHKSVTALEKQIKRISQTADGQGRHIRKLDTFLQTLQNTVQRGYNTHRNAENVREFHLRYISGLWSWDFWLNRLSFPSFWFACRQHVEGIDRVGGGLLLFVLFFAIFALAPSLYTKDEVQANEPAYMKEYFRRNVY